MKERIFNKDQYINEELKKANVRREDFDRWVNILKEEYDLDNKLEMCNKCCKYKSSLNENGVCKECDYIAK